MKFVGAIMDRPHSATLKNNDIFATISSEKYEMGDTYGITKAKTEPSAGI